MGKAATETASLSRFLHQISGGLTKERWELSCTECGMADTVIRISLETHQENILHSVMRCFGQKINDLILMPKTPFTGQPIVCFPPLKILTPVNAMQLTTKHKS